MFNPIHDGLADHLHFVYRAIGDTRQLFRWAGSRTREEVTRRRVHRPRHDFDGVPLAACIDDGDGA
jgi:hypothetical protein